MTTPTINIAEQDYLELISLLAARGVTVYESSGAGVDGNHGFTGCESDCYDSFDEALEAAARAHNLVVIGDDYRFSTDSTHANYAAQDGTVVRVTGRLLPAVSLQDSDRIFHIEGEGGFVGVAYESELTAIKQPEIHEDCGEKPVPVCCPFCSRSTLSNVETDWRAVSAAEPDNDATLTEYQCRNDACGLSFWL